MGFLFRAVVGVQVAQESRWHGDVYKCQGAGARARARADGCDPHSYAAPGSGSGFGAAAGAIAGTGTGAGARALLVLMLVLVLALGCLVVLRVVSLMISLGNDITCVFDNLCAKFFVFRYRIVIYKQWARRGEVL